MIALRFNFIAGRYHATPWDKQVNEGTVEWPPSPWRLLRALIAVWYQKGQDSIKPKEFVILLDKLSGPPEYLLPPTTVAHTRHFMPIGEIKDEKENTALILDTFIAIPKSKPLVVIWNDVELSSEERQALKLLASGIYYFGRSESWTETGIIDSPELDEIRKDNSYHKAYLAKEFPENGDCTPVKLLACMGSEEYVTWKDENKNSTELPESVFEALQAQTSDWKNDGWDKPPGSKLVQYALQKGALNVRPEFVPRKQGERPPLARFAVASAVRPSLRYSLSLAERVHAALVKWSDGEPVFTGCDEKGKPLENHMHARIFCESASGQPALRRTVSHITVYAPSGFNEKAEHALRSIEKVWGYGGYDIKLMLLGIGNAREFTDTLLLAKSRRWKSVTPFVPTRHPKSTRAGKPKLDAENGLQIGSPEHDLLRLLKLDGVVPTRVECKPLGIADHSLLGFTVERKTGGGRRCGNTGYSCLLEFDKPIEGPIAVGYGSHFGLGLFTPLCDERKVYPNVL